MMISPECVPLARGRTAEVYAWHDGTILKLFYDWCPLSWVRHEIEIGRAVASSGLPAPKLLAATQVDGRPGIVFERVEGPTMLSAINSKPWMLTKYARLFSEVHAHIHEHSGAGFPPLRPALKRTIEQTETLPFEARASALEALSQLPDGSAPCHGDFHPDQLVLSPHGPMVIDWITAHQGSPAADVARTLLLFAVGQVPHGSRLQRAFINAGRGLVARTYLARYLELRPEVSEDEVRSWMVPVAAARMNEGIPGERQPLLDLILASRQP